MTAWTPSVTAAQSVAHRVHASVRAAESALESPLAVDSPFSPKVHMGTGPSPDDALHWDRADCCM